jgi:hypothetical protein
VLIWRAAVSFSHRHLGERRDPQGEKGSASEEYPTLSPSRNRYHPATYGRPKEANFERAA